MYMYMYRILYCIYTCVLAVVHFRLCIQKACNVHSVSIFCRLLHFHKPKPSGLARGVSLLAESTSMEGETDPELLALCSGKFETQSNPTIHSAMATSDSYGSCAKKLPRQLGGLGKLVSQSAERDAVGATDMSEVLGLCSGVFPATQTQREEKEGEKGESPFVKFGADVHHKKPLPPLDYSSDSSSEGEGEGLLSWAKRQKKLTSMLALRGNQEEDDDIMPKLTRKRKRGRPKPKATKE